MFQLLLIFSIIFSVYSLPPDFKASQTQVDNTDFSISGSWKKEWETFKKTFSKIYTSLAEESLRASIFMDNWRYVNEHNKLYAEGKKSFSLKINHLADLSSRELTRMLNGFLRTYNFSGAPRMELAASYGDNQQASVSLPDVVDWRKKNVVTPPKDQGQCGSCWSFSTTGALEGQHAINTGTLVSLSEQQLIDCSVRFGNHGCNGGLMDQAFQYVASNGGIDTEKCYPYQMKQNPECFYKRSCMAATCDSYVDLPQGDEAALKKATANIGPISVAIDASHPSFHFYHQGVYDEPQCSSTQLDHGVLVVGYGVDHDSGEKYWLVKNSWGESYGLNGYVKMSRDRDNQCGIATQASYPTGVKIFHY